MSRGIGWVQRRVLEVLEDGRSYVPRGLAVEVFETGGATLVETPEAVGTAATRLTTSAPSEETPGIGWGFLTW